MTHLAYPTASDLTTYLQEAGYDTTGVALAGPAASGWQELERRTKRTLLAGSSASRSFDPPRTGNVLRIDEAAAITSLGYLRNGETDPEIWLAETHYQLLPLNAPSKGEPYTRIRLLRGGWGRPVGPARLGDTNYGLSGSYGYEGYGCLSAMPGLFVIEAQWGAFLSIPDDAWEGMLAGGALKILARLHRKLRKGVSKLTDSSGNSMTFADGLTEDDLREIADDAVALYRKPSL